MKKVLLAVMIFAMSSFAQIGLDVAGEFAMPMGDFADGSGMGFGGNASMDENPWKMRVGDSNEDLTWLIK